VKWLLVHNHNDNLAKEWQKWFGGEPDVEMVDGDICRVPADAIVSPANSFGFMDGGLDQALSTRFGWDLQKKLQRAIAARPLQELLVGEALIFPTGDATTPWLIAAPTMRVPMRLRQSVNAYLAMKAILAAALAHAADPSIHSVAIPGLGTGVGGLSAATAALQMWRAYEEIALYKTSYPAEFGEAQRRHFELNPQEIMIWD
jgi:O-acetyl-ADP-ribose deacetylase (regulator of RNase III)